MSPSGKFLVTWTDDGARARVLAQLFSPDGRSLGVPVQVHDNVPGAQFVGRSAALGSHGYVVVWNDEDYETGRVNLKMRFLDPEGKRRGPVLRVNEEDRHTRLGGQIAADRQGNFFVVWQEGGPPGTFGRGWDVWGRLFRPDGTPVGPKQVLNRYTLDDQTEPYVVAGVNGTFIVVWQSYGQDGDAEGIFGQIVAASPADEVCALGASGLRCDLARSGGKAELEMNLAPGGETVFGDWDGDGRVDPCRFDAGSWSCDLDHFGAPAEVSLSFGQSGDHPLLGDFNGDGHADPCVQRGTQLLCDTARDGGQSELTLDLGQPTDALSLADVDGDGRAEACTIHGASFLCDTGHDGGAFEWERRFGEGTGMAAFGDTDGDGRDEPCVLSGSELLCDSAQAAVHLTFPIQPGERLVLVNLDGL
jgi:hypothetical protein